MTLQALYRLHDDLEAALRELDRLPVSLRRVRRLTWRAHDRLERIVVKAQARRARRR